MLPFQTFFSDKSKMNKENWKKTYLRKQIEQKALKQETLD